MREPVRDPAAPSDGAVRDLVRRIVDATLDGGAPTSSPAAAAMPAAPSFVSAQIQPSTTNPGPAAPDTGSASGTVGIAIGADHGGWQLKDAIGRAVADAGFAVTDCGTNGPDAVDYPDIAHAVARLVADGTCRWGIIVDGAGIGSCMVANKVPGVRAALCHDLSSARNSREHNHANVLTLGARFTGEGLALEIVRAWLGTPWGPGRHAARVEKISDVERRYLLPTAEARPR
jgi:ribose 5-phosphate isomerase B